MTVAEGGAAARDEKYGRQLEERLARLREQRTVLQRELNLACAALSPAAETPKDDAVASIVYDRDGRHPARRLTGRWRGSEALNNLYTTDAAKVVRLTRETQSTAAKMSANLRKRDTERVPEDLAKDWGND